MRVTPFLPIEEGVRRSGLSLWVCRSAMELATMGCHIVRAVWPKILFRIFVLLGGWPFIRFAQSTVCSYRIAVRNAENPSIITYAGWVEGRHWKRMRSLYVATALPTFEI